MPEQYKIIVLYGLIRKKSVYLHSSIICIAHRKARQVYLNSPTVYLKRLYIASQHHLPDVVREKQLQQ